MKEQNKKRKLALKRAKEKRELRKALRKDIVQYMVDFFMENIPNYRAAVEEHLEKGLKGFDGCKNAMLVKEFEKLFTRLSLNKEPRVLFCDEMGTYSSNSHRRQLDGEEYELRRRAYLEVGDALMSRLIEIKFDLDFE